MDIMYQIIAGIFSGIVAGMGMGGGTFLIPVLTIFFAVNQHIAQGINLVAFVLTASFALCVHFYKKLVVWKVALPIIASGVIFSIAGSTLSNRLNADSLRVLFGVFLLLVGVYQVVSAIITIVKNRNKDSDIKVNKKYKLAVFTTKMFK